MFSGAKGFCFAYFLTFPYFLIEKVLGGPTSSICALGFDELSESCLRCSPQYYKSSLEGNIYFPLGDCHKKDSTNTYIRSAWIANRACLQGSKCDGSFDSPFDTIFKAFYELNLEAAAFTEVRLNFFLLGADHFLLESHLRSLAPYVPFFFRGLNATINIAPWFCDQGQIEGCFSERDQRATVQLKTNKFFFFYSNALTITNIVFDGSDIHILNRNDPEQCLLSSSVCCNESTVNIESHSCFIYSQSYSALEGSGKFGLFNPDRMVGDVARVIPKLNLTDCEFNNVYLLERDGPGFYSLFLLTELSSTLFLRNIRFSNIFIEYGIINQVSSLDIYLARIPDIDMPETKADLQNIEVSAYNQYLVFSLNSQQSTPTLFQLSNSLNMITRFENIIVKSSPFQGGIVVFSFRKAGKLVIRNLEIIEIGPHALVDASDTDVEIENLSASEMSFTEPLKRPYLRGEGSVWVLKGVNLVNLEFQFSWNDISEYIFSFSYLKSIYLDNGRIVGGQNCYWKIQYSQVTLSNFLLSSHFLDITLFRIKNSVCQMLNFVITNTFFYYDEIFFIWNEGPEQGFLALHDFSISRSGMYSDSISTKIFNWPLCQSNDFFQLNGFEISKVAVRYYLSFFDNSYFPYIDFKNILIVNVPYPLTLIALGDFQELQLHNMTLRNSVIGYYVLSLSCSLCQLIVREIVLENILLKNYDAFIFYVPYVIFEKFTVTNFTTRDRGLKVFLVLWFSEALLYDMNFNLATASKSAELDFIFFIDWASQLSIKQIKFRVSQGTTLSLAGLFNCNYIENISMEDVDAQNFNCNPLAGSIAKENGIINFLGSSSYMPEDFPTSVTISNLIIMNTVNCINGVMGFVSYLKIKIYNTTFYNCSSYQGGVISIRNSLETEIRFLKAEKTKAFYGGAVFAFNVSSFNADNLLVKNSRASTGGAILFRGSQQAKIVMSIFSNLIATSSGGAISGMNSGIEISSVEIFNSICEKEGGAIYLSRSRFKASGSLLSHTTQADIGGFMLAMECGTLSFTGVIVYDALANSKGSAFQFVDCSELQMSSVSVFLNKVPAGSGTINAESQSSFGLFFSGIFCYNNVAIQGSCFFVFANNQTTVLNSSMINNIGSLISVSSPSLLERSELFLKNVQFRDNNKDQTDLVPEYLLIGEKADLTVWNVTLNKNVFKSSFVFFSNCKSLISNLEFSESNAEFADGFYPALFEYHSCDISLQNLTFKGHQKLDLELLYVVYSNLSFTNSNINSCLTSDYSCVFTEKSSVELYNVTFSNCSGMRSGAIYLSESRAVIKKSNFESNTFKTSSASAIDNSLPNDICVYEGIDTLIFNCLFKTVRGISTTLLRSNKTIIEGSFYLGSGVFDSRALYALDSTLKINLTEFSNYSSTSGGCLYLYSKNLLSNYEIRIAESKFSFNKAFFGGAFFILGFFPLIAFESNDFNSNQAVILDPEPQSGIGAVGLFVCSNCKKSKLILLHNSFTQNFAERFGRTLISQATIDHRDKEGLETNSFNDNLDGSDLKLDLLYFPLKLVHCFVEKNITESDLNATFFQNISTSSKASQVSSGIAFKYLVILTDSQEQLLSLDTFARAILSEVSVANRSFFRIEERIAKCVRGVCFFAGVKVNTNPNSTFQLRLTIDFSLRDLLFYSLEESKVADSLVNLSTFPCIKGELFVEGDQTCFKCPRGKYSFSDPMDKTKQGQKCLDCPADADCPGGSMITPLPGYWRASEESTLIIECLSKSSCLGNVMSDNKSDFVHGLCKENHHGVLCYTCSNGYARNFPKDICRPCRSNVFLYFKIVIAMFILLAYIGFQVQITFRANSASNAGILMKQLINHFQQVGMISLVDLGWTPDIKSYFSFQEYFSFLSEEFITIDCFVAELGYDLLTQKIIFTNILPIFLSILTLVMWLVSFSLMVFIKRIGNQTVKRVFDKARVSIMIIVYLLFPEILRKCFSLVNCILINNSTGETVLMYSPHIKCWDSEHVTYILIAALPGLIIWGVITPVFIYNLLRMHRKFIITYIRGMNRVENKDELHDEAIEVISNIQSGKLTEATMETKKNKKFLYFFNVRDQVKSRKKDTTATSTTIRKMPENNFFPEASLNDKTARNSLMNNNKNPQKNSLVVGGFRKSNLIVKNSKQSLVMNEIKLFKNNFIGNDVSEANINSYSSTRQEIISRTMPPEDLAQKTDVSGYEIRESTFISRLISTLCGVSGCLKSLADKLNCCNQRSEVARVQTLERKEEIVIKRETGIMLKFLYKGYAPKMYYWEMVMFSKKFILILIGSFNDVFPPNTKAIFLLITMTFYIWLQTKYKPFETDYLNNIEYLSLITSFLTANMGIMLFTDDLKKISQLFLILIILFNVGFVLNWFRYLKKHVLKKLTVRNLIDILVMKTKKGKIREKSRTHSFNLL